MNDRTIGLLEHQRRSKGRDLDMAACVGGRSRRIPATHRSAEGYFPKGQGAMPESFLGLCLLIRGEPLPVAWTPGALAEGVQLARLNKPDNHQPAGRGILLGRGAGA